MGPPSDQPKIVARGDPAASITARTSPTRSSTVCSPTRSESPWPRLSKTMTRAKDVSLFEQVLVDGELPVELGVGKRSRDEDEIARPLAEDSVGDVDVAALRVFDVASHGRRPSPVPRTSAAVRS